MELEEGGMQYVADLQSLEDFFGAKPVLESENIPMYRNCVKVEAVFPHMRVWLSFVPYVGIGQLRLSGTPFSVFDLQLSDITHLSVRKTAEDHYLLIRFNRKATSNLKLRLRPHVLLFWGNEPPSEEDNTEFIQKAAPQDGGA